VIRSRRDLHDVLTILVAAGVIYTLPILWELRMSPMLHVNLYGFASRSDWLQNLRLGGYRPTVFMGHGLVVGFFMFICTTAAVILHQAGKRQVLRAPLGYIVLFLFGILFLVKAAAALIYGAVGFVLIRFLSVKSQMRILLALAVLVVSYPISRLTNVFPTEALLSAAGTLGADRVQSLQFRFDNEDILVMKGEERPIFGWGGFSRERVYDDETGKDLVIQDGYWIAWYGTHGMLGFICFFAMLLWPIYQVARNIHRISARTDRIMLAGLAYIVVICGVNMLPNMTLPNLQFFFAGGLATLMKELLKQATFEAKQSAKGGAKVPSAAPNGLRHAG
jgi:O-antigen ligase